MKIILLFTILISSINAQSYFGVDVPVYFSNSFVSIPENYETLEGEGGKGSDIGFGLYFQYNENIIIKAGYHYWNKKFNPKHTGRFTIGNNIMEGKIIESGSIDYRGFYLLGIYKIKFIYLGGGFDIALSNSYESTLKVYDRNEQLFIKQSNVKESFITEKFNNQIDFFLYLGFKIKVNNILSLVPSVQFALPYESLFDSNASVYDPLTGETRDLRFDAYLLKYGFSIEFGVL